MYLKPKDFFIGKSEKFINLIESKIDKVLIKEHDPYLLPDIHEALALIEKHKNESITILGDFDADGITSTSILVIGLQELLNNKKIYYIVPEREDGHGLNKENINIAIKNNSKLIITCDNASNDIEMINFAKENGIDVIVTDHHEIENNNDQLDFPLINAGRPGFYPCPYFCGAGVAYKFLQAIEKFYNINLNEKTLEKIRMLTVIGTIADKVKLKDENLLFILQYRKYFDNPSSKIFQELNKLLNYNPKDGKWFGWKICPLFNVAGRLGKSNLLIETIINGENYENLTEVLEYFIELNEKRKELTQAWIEFTNKNNLVEKRKYTTLIIHEQIPSGIKRLIGNEFLNNQISFCGNIKNGEVHCSVTNQLNANVLEFLKDKHYTINAGGHYKAFGYTFKLENKNEFLDDLELFLQSKEDKLFDFHEDTIAIENPKKDLSEKYIEEINEFIWSSGIEEPIFESELIVKNTFLLKGTHLKITFEDGTIGMKWFYKNFSNFPVGKSVKVKYNPNLNEWNGKKSLQLILI